MDRLSAADRPRPGRCARLLLNYGLGVTGGNADTETRVTRCRAAVPDVFLAPRPDG